VEICLKLLYHGESIPNGAIPFVFEEFQPYSEHHNYKEMETILQSMAKKYPAITRLYSIGQSVEGRELYVMEITDLPGNHELGNKKRASLENIFFSWEFSNLFRRT